MSMGEILKSAREQRGLSASAVAEATHMKVQIIEDLENEDFRRIAAPIYGRGFVKLYAEFLELDPASLIREFMDLYSGKRSPVVGRRPVEPAPAPAMEQEPTPVTRTVRSMVEKTIQPLVKPLVRPVETAPAPEPPPAPAAPVPSPEPEPINFRRAAPEPEEDDDPLTLTPCLTPTHTLTPTVPERPVVAPPKEEPPAEEMSTEESEPSEKRWVVEPETPFEDPTGEPDLFSQHMPQRQPVTTTPLAPMEPPKKKASAQKRRSGPIFDMSRLDTSPVPESAQDEKSTERQNEHLKAFMESFKRLRTTAFSKGFSDTFLQQYRYALIAAAAILLICMLTGVLLLFSMTSNPKKEMTTHKFQQVAPIPAMYAD